MSRRTLRFAKESAQRTNSALSASPMSSRHPAAPIPHRSPEQDHNTSRKLLNPLFELLRIPSPKHGQANRHHHESPRGLSLQPFSTHYNSLASFFVTHGTSSILFIAGIHFLPVLLHNQGYPKVCPNSLNLSNADDSFAGTSLLSSCSLFFPTRDLIA
jgi:hypothetical protein